jgi:hypothetical protein
MENVSLVIDDAVAAIIRAPLATPFRIATGQHDELVNVFLSGALAHSPYLDDSGKFDLHRAGHGIGVAPSFT